MINTVIFDLDDTLYDEIDYCKSGFNAVAHFLAQNKDMPIETIFDSLWRQFTNGNTTSTFNASLDQLKIAYDKPLICQLIKLYREHNPDITLPAESKEILTELKTKYNLALLTDGFLPAQQLKVEALGLEKYFQAIIYTEKLGRQFWKPSPVGFIKIAEMLNTEQKNCAYIADNEKKDFIAPNQLGFVTVKISRPSQIHKDTSSDEYAKPKYVIGQLKDLSQLLNRL